MNTSDIENLINSIRGDEIGYAELFTIVELMLIQLKTFEKRLNVLEGNTNE